MAIISDEMKAELKKAASDEELAELLKAAGMDEAIAGQIRRELGSCREDKELSIDELAAVSGGADRDWLKEGCAATVEADSWCGLNDKCYWIDVTYDHVPVSTPCPQCGGQMYYYEAEIVSKYESYDYLKCLSCGHVVKKRR